MYVCVCVCVCVCFSISECIRLKDQDMPENVTAWTCKCDSTHMFESVVHFRFEFCNFACTTKHVKKDFVNFLPALPPPPLNSRAELANLLAILNLSLLVDVICLP